MNRNEIIERLNYGWPTAEWSWDGDDYDDLAWIGGGDKPLLAEVEAVVIPEPAPPVPEEISRWQFYYGLFLTGKITDGEAFAAVANGVIPSAIETIVDAISDAPAKLLAKMLLVSATSFYRSHPLVSTFAASEGMTDGEVDDFWRLCASLA